MSGIDLLAIVILAISVIFLVTYSLTMRDQRNRFKNMYDEERERGERFRNQYSSGIVKMGKLRRALDRSEKYAKTLHEALCIGQAKIHDIQGLINTGKSESADRLIQDYWNEWKDNFFPKFKEAERLAWESKEDTKDE